jgi:Amt family ammonium transporter
VDGLDTGDTAWMLASTALVLLMTPGLAFFYGGMVRSKSVLNMMMMSLSAMGLVGILWALYGYSVAFGNDVGAGLLGNPFEAWGLKGLFVGSYTGDAISYPLSGTIPALVFVGFQATFAIITVALISGAVADRMKFGAWLLFAAIWATVVYFPVAHWVFAFSNDDSGVVGGWIANNLAAIDFAGGTAVHINAGAAALALALVIGKRRGWPREPMRPHNLPFVMLGAGLLWFGWFGFNAGSALGANGIAGFAMINTVVATCAAMLGWLITEKFRDGKPTSLGAASGVVAGLVAITPSCSSVSPMGAILLGLIAGVVCALAVGLKFRFGYDDSLDVVGVHLVGGIIGTVLVGILADPGSPAGVAGLFYGGGVDQLWRQVVGAAAVLIYSFVLSYVIALVVKAIMGLRIENEDEINGIDEAEHAETAYDFSSLRSISGAGTPRPDAATPAAAAHVPAHASKEG